MPKKKLGPEWTRLLIGRKWLRRSGIVRKRVSHTILEFSVREHDYLLIPVRLSILPSSYTRLIIGCVLSIQVALSLFMV